MSRLLLIILLCGTTYGAPKYHSASVKDVATGKANYPAVRVRGIVADVRTEGAGTFWLKICESRARKHCIDVRFETPLHGTFLAPNPGEYVEVTAIRNP